MGGGRIIMFPKDPETWRSNGRRLSGRPVISKLVNY